MTQTHKIEEFVKRYCDKTEWNSSLNKNQHRERLRRTLNESEMMRFGVERLVDDAVSAKEHSFYSPIERAVRSILGIDEAAAEQAVHENHNHTNDVVDMDIDDQDDNMDDKGEQDMELSDADDAGTIEPIQSRIEAFVRSFREVPSLLDVKQEPEPAPDVLISSIPMPSGPSSQSSVSPSELEAPMYSPIRPDDGAFIKIEPQADSCPNIAQTTAGRRLTPDPSLQQENSQPNETTNQPLPQTPAQPPLPPKLTLIKQEPIDASESVHKKESPQEPASISPPDAASKNLKRQPPALMQQRSEQPQQSTRQPAHSATAGKEKKDRTRRKSLPTVKQEPTAVSELPELEEILSDVSSVHTSDLSDYDDQISISSAEEDAEDKKKISLQEVRKLEEKVKKGSNSNNNREKQASKSLKKSQKAVSSNSGKKSSGRRERKVNPKYTSDEYSSIFGKKSGSLLEGEEDIDSEEDFDQDHHQAVPVKEEAASSDSLDDSSSFIDIHPKGVTTTTSKKNADQEASEAVDSPSISKPAVKKKIPRKLSERYDASDLYKPRPVIGSSRRNRSHGNSSTAADT